MASVVKSVPTTAHQILTSNFISAPANVELGLFSSDFSTLFSQSTGFLSKQNTIKKITALQFVRNLASKSSYQLMAVFGTDAKGLANLGYVGYTEQYTSYNFNRSAPFTTFTVGALSGDINLLYFQLAID